MLHLLNTGRISTAIGNSNKENNVEPSVFQIERILDEFRVEPEAVQNALENSARVSEDVEKESKDLSKWVEQNPNCV